MFEEQNQRSNLQIKNFTRASVEEKSISSQTLSPKRTEPASVANETIVNMMSDAPHEPIESKSPLIPSPVLSPKAG